MSELASKLPMEATVQLTPVDADEKENENVSVQRSNEDEEEVSSELVS